MYIPIMDSHHMKLILPLIVSICFCLPAFSWCQDDDKITQTASEAFEYLDTNNDDSIQQSELEEYLYSPKQLFKLADYDYDNSNELDLDELKKLLEREVFKMEVRRATEPKPKAESTPEEPLEPKLPNRNTPLIKEKIDLISRKINLPIKPLQCEFSFDGTRVAIAGIEKNDIESKKPNVILIYDAISNEILTTKKFDEVFHDLAIDDQFVYIRQGDVLIKLEQNTLEENVRKQFSKKDNHNRNILLYPNQKLGIVDADHTWDIVNTDDLTNPVDRSRYIGSNENLQENSRYSLRINQKFKFASKNRIKIGRHYFDFSSRKRLLAMTLMKILRSKITRHSAFIVKPKSNQQQHTPNITTYGRQITKGDVIIDCDGRTCGSIESNGGPIRYQFVSLTYPVIYTVYDSGSKTVFEARQIKDGRLVYSTDANELTREFKRAGNLGSPNGNSFARIQHFPEKIVIVRENDVTTIELPKIKSSLIEMPLNFLESELAVIEDDSMTVELQTQGGVGKLHFEFEFPYGGVSIDHQTGQISISTSDFFEDYLKHGGKSLPEHALESIQGYHDSLKDFSERVYQDHLGKDLPLDKLAMLIAPRVICHDESGQVAAMQIPIVVATPRRPIEQFIAKKAQRKTLRKLQQLVNGYIQKEMPRGLIVEVSIDELGNVKTKSARELTDDEEKQLDAAIEGAKKRYGIEGKSG